MLWACIAFPQLALDCVLRRQEDPGRALALVGGPVQARELIAVNRAAWQRGLRAGQRLTMARAISDDFAVVLHDPEESRQWQHELLASWAYGLSTQVHTGYPQALLLEVGASLRLMGGWPAFERRLRADLSALRFQHRIAVAPTPRAAHVLAWWQDGLCIGLPATPAHPSPGAGLSHPCTPELNPSSASAHIRHFTATLPENRDHNSGQNGNTPAPSDVTRAAARAMPPDSALMQVLGTLPVRHAGLPDDAGESLHRMGVRTLRHLFSMPRDGLQRRFGDALLLHLDQLRGLVPEALDFFRPADRFDLRQELPCPVDNHQLLLFPMQRLLSDLVAFLNCRDRGVQNFCIHLEHETVRKIATDTTQQDHTRPDQERHQKTVSSTSAATTCVEIGLLSAERDPALLLDLVRTRFEQVHLTSPVVAMRLVAEHLPGFVPSSSDLFDERPDTALPWPQLRERLRARLGDKALHQLQTVADPRPERAWRRHEPAPVGMGDGCRLQSLHHTPPENTAPDGSDCLHAMSGGADHAPRRNHLQPRKQHTRKNAAGAHAPQRPTASANAMKPALSAMPASPRHHDMRHVSGSNLRPAWLLPEPRPLQVPVARILSGPERVESGWWDEHDVRRDYYVLETVTGQHAWAFSAPGQRGPWMLHGWF